MFYLINNEIKLGCHFPFDKTFERTVTNMYKSNYNAFQIYLSYKWSSDMRDTKDLLKARNILQLKDMVLFIHGSNMYNLCGLLTKPQNNEAMWASIINELDCGVMLNSPVVLHMGSCKNPTEGVKLMVKNICHVLNTITSNTKKYAQSIGITCEEFISKRYILLENSSHEGTKLGYSLDGIADILNMLHTENKNVYNRVGICIDTCHAYVSGMTDWSEPKIFFKNFNAKIGLHKLKLVHLNDTLQNFESRKDRHAPIFFGKIFNDDLSRITYILNKCKKYQIGIVQEVNIFSATISYEILAQLVMCTDNYLYKPIQI